MVVVYHLSMAKLQNCIVQQSIYSSVTIPPLKETPGMPAGSSQSVQAECNISQYI